jgi:hypothetical protein
MAEQEDLEQQLNNVSDDDLLLGGDDGSELEESELSVNRKKNIIYLFIFLRFRLQKLLVISCHYKVIKIQVLLIFHVMIMILIQMENLEQDIFVFMKNYHHLHVFGSIIFLILNYVIIFLFRPLSETLREAAERQGI